MNIPNFPTDNLYKFLTIFGFVLLISGIYIAYNERVDLSTKIDELTIKEQSLLVIKKHQVKTPENKLDFLADSIALSVNIERLKNKVELFQNHSSLCFIIAIAGSGLLIFGIIKWHNKTQIYQDKILKNEAEKYLNDKSIIIHKVQFEKEFEIYTELWSKLISLRDTTFALRAKRINNNISYDVKLKSFWESFRIFLKLYEQNKPFYPKEIEEVLSVILKTTHKESIHFEMLEPSEENYFKEADINMDLIITEIDNVCLKIRERIGIITITN